jgi:hypothetical protein
MIGGARRSLGSEFSSSRPTQAFHAMVGIGSTPSQKPWARSSPQRPSGQRTPAPGPPASGRAPWAVGQMSDGVGHSQIAGPAGPQA